MLPQTDFSMELFFSLTPTCFFSNYFVGSYFPSIRLSIFSVCLFLSLYNSIFFLTFCLLLQNPFNFFPFFLFIILSLFILSPLILSALIASYFILFYVLSLHLILSYLLLSYLLSSHLILSYLLLSYLLSPSRCQVRLSFHPEVRSRLSRRGPWVNCRESFRCAEDKNDDSWRWLE